MRSTNNPLANDFSTAAAAAVQAEMLPLRSMFMKTFRKIICWMHLTAGLSAGIVIFIMCVTGALLAFEKNIIEWAERDARYVSVKSESEPLGPQEILAAVSKTKPSSKPSSMAKTNDPAATFTVSLGREGQVFVDPYSGTITGESSVGVRSFFRTVTDLHRFIAMSGDARPVGKTITGASNLIFLFIAISGIYIWMPRKFTWGRIKPVVWFRGGLKGKARNFNWHNTIGFWTSLFLIVLTLTATVISYQWASNLIFTLTGNQAPQQQGGPPNTQPSEADQLFVLPENLNAVWQTAETKAPGWKSISLRLPIEKDSAVFTIDEGIYWNIFDAHGRCSNRRDRKMGAVRRAKFGAAASHLVSFHAHGRKRRHHRPVYRIRCLRRWSISCLDRVLSRLSALWKMDEKSLERRRRSEP